jgi:hypothetical protein
LVTECFIFVANSGRQYMTDWNEAYRANNGHQADTIGSEPPRRRRNGRASPTRSRLAEEQVNDSSRESRAAGRVGSIVDRLVTPGSAPPPQKERRGMYLRWGGVLAALAGFALFQAAPSIEQAHDRMVFGWHEADIMQPALNGLGATAMGMEGRHITSIDHGRLAIVSATVIRHCEEVGLTATVPEGENDKPDPAAGTTSVIETVTPAGGVGCYTAYRMVDHQRYDLARPGPDGQWVATGTLEAPHPLGSGVVDDSLNYRSRESYTATEQVIQMARDTIPA